MSCLCAGGAIVSPVSNAVSADSPDDRLMPDHTSSLPPVPQTAASTSGPYAPFASPLPQAPFRSPFPVGSAMGSAHQPAPFGSPLPGNSEMSAAYRRAPFGSSPQAPAFGSGSGSPAFFTPAASVNPEGTNVLPASTIAFGGMAFGTPATVFGTPASAFGTPLSGFGSPAFHTPAATPGGHPFGNPLSGRQAFGTPASAFDTPAALSGSGAATAFGGGPADASSPVVDALDMGGGQDAASDGPFGAPAFGSKPSIIIK